MAWHSTSVAMFFDDPDGILAYQKRRDEGLGTDDRFMWILDTFLDGRTGYFFEINPAGLMGDGLLRAGGNVNKAWDGVWEARVQRLDNGWSAEIRIPWSTLNFNPESDTWGINFQRTIRRKQEEILWTAHRRTEGLWRPIHAGRLTGLSDMSQGIGLEVKPYVVAGWTSTNDAGGLDELPTRPGVRRRVFDHPKPASRGVLQYRLCGSGSRPTASEPHSVSPPVPRTTRFLPRRVGSLHLRTPKRRGALFQPAYRTSRRQPGPHPVRYPTRWASRALRGRIPPGRNGRPPGHRRRRVHRVSSEETDLRKSPRSARSTRDAQAVPTSRAPAPPTTIRRASIWTSGPHGFSATRISRSTASSVWNSNSEPTVDRTLPDLSARGIRFDFPNDIWQMHLSYREFGSFYDPAVGFVTRNGFRRVEPNVTWRPRPDISWIRQFEFGTQFRYLASIETGRPEERQWQVDILNIDFENSADLDFGVTRQFENLDRAFEISDGIVIQPGEYWTWEWEVSGGTPNQERISLDAGVGGGSFWNGDRFGYELEFGYRPTPGVELGLEYERDEVALPQGAFDTNLFRLNTAWDISPWSSVTGNVQYDDVSEIFGLFLKTRWIIAPGNDLYLVYTQNWQKLRADQLDQRFTTLSQGGITKLNYTFRF